MFWRHSLKGFPLGCRVNFINVILRLKVIRWRTLISCSKHTFCLPHHFQTTQNIKQVVTLTLFSQLLQCKMCFASLNNEKNWLSEEIYLFTHKQGPIRHKPWHIQEINDCQDSAHMELLIADAGVGVLQEDNQPELAGQVLSWVW